MLERILDFLLCDPRRLVALGQAMLRAGAFLFIAGIAGATATTIASVVSGTATRTRPVVELADLMAGFPVWWVPETAVGYGLALCCASAGYWAVHTGRTYLRVLRY